MEKTVFKNFAEYWSFAKPLSLNQRNIIFNNLQSSEQKKLEKAYVEEGWEDVLVRNTIDSFIDDTKETLNIDLVEIKIKVFSGKSIYLRKSQWDFICDILKGFNPRHTDYILGGIEVEVVNNETVLLKKDIYGSKKKN